MKDDLRIGVSSCLMGQEVRWDAGHKRSRFVTDVLSPFVTFVPVCPEVELGLGVPRETVRLVAGDDGPRMLTTKTGIDHTRAMNRYARRRVSELVRLDLSGYVLKKDSPSCGMERVRLYPAEGGRQPERKGRGLFAAALMEACPRLPVEEEGRLQDPVLRENFIERVFAYRRLMDLFSGRWTLGKLVAFHTAHKLQLLSHSPESYRSLGRLVAGARDVPRAELREAYCDEFMAALARQATRRRHLNALQHVAGYFRKRLDKDARAELAGLIEDYGAGLVPLVVPITLLRHYVRRFDETYLAGQFYLEPHPKELMLRNHV